MFLHVGLSVAKTMVPGVAAVETAIVGAQKGGDRRAAVLDLVKGGLITSEALSGAATLLDDPDFIDGVDLELQGAVKIMNAIKRHHAAAPAALT